MKKMLDDLTKFLWQQTFGKYSQEPALTDLRLLTSIWDVAGSVDWLVDGLIAKGSVTLISSESGTGKTWLAYYIAGCVAKGRKVLGRRTEQAEVLYVDGENPVSVGKRNLDALGIPKTAALHVWGGWCAEQPMGPSEKRVQQFAKRGGLIIYDSLVEFHPGDEQSASGTRPYMADYRRLANLGATVIILHHTGKGENTKDYRGSSDIKAAVDMAYVLEEDSKNNGKLGRLTLRSFKARLAPPPREVMGLEFKEGVGFVEWDAPQPQPDATIVMGDIVREHPGLNQGGVVGIARRRGLSKGEAEGILRENRQNKFQVVPGQRAAKMYYLAEAPSPPEPVPTDADAEASSTAETEEVLV